MSDCIYCNKHVMDDETAGERFGKANIDNLYHRKCLQDILDEWDRNRPPLPAIASLFFSHSTDTDVAVLVMDEGI